jgi:dihydroorotase
VFGLPGGRLAEGMPADLTVIDTDRRTVVDAFTQKTKSRNTPFNGWELRGGVALTMVGGRIVHRVTG